MNQPPRRPPSGRGWRHRGRRWFFIGVGFLLVVILGLILVRPDPEPYTPGLDSENNSEITRRLTRTLPEDVPALHFVDSAAEAGIRFRHFQGRRSTQLPEDMGSGAAWGDYDGDGDPDLFLVNESGPLGTPLDSGAGSSLYRNDGNGRFTDVTRAAGIEARGMGMGAAWGDYDGDEDLDLVVSRFGTNLLYRNEGDGTFSDVSGASGIGDATGFWAGVTWNDFDRDGDLDLYVCGYVQYRNEGLESTADTFQYKAVVPYTLNPSSYSPERNLLFENRGGEFREIAEKLGIHNPAGRSLSAAWADFDQDGWPDLYVANDISDNALYRNVDGTRFEDLSHSAWVADYRGAMGLAVGDHENDGDFDIFVTHWLAQENALYENQAGIIAASESEPLHFMDEADILGLGQISIDFIGWGTEFADFDNDGWLDLFVANGSTFQRPDDPSQLVAMKNELFWNGGQDRGFFAIGPVSGDAFGSENVGRGVAVADYDLDGDLDVLVMVNGAEARLLRNEVDNDMGWLRLLLRGSRAPEGLPTEGGFKTTTFARGAVVRVSLGDEVRNRLVGGSPSYLSQTPPGEVHFGLGRATQVDRLEVMWPSGLRQTFFDVPAGRTLFLREGEDLSEYQAATRAASR